MIKVSPSVLASDFSHLADEVKKIENSGADYVHLDVMDGVFVPNITFGAPVIKALRPHSKITFDVHLMIVDPIRYIKDFVDAGADIITFHYESCENHEEVIDLIHSYGIKAAISLKPNTSYEVLKPLIHKLDMVLVMTVEPGYGGQKFIEKTLDTIRGTAGLIKEIGADIDIEVDGGIYEENACVPISAGANVIVAGSAFFKSFDPATTVHKLRGN
ncbi:MAG: ribulose-phosphate 3-epimerase [Ruminococcaceae bacterium]|nr:ribulose-phosphate 3-epimerase [Oscillospiraceae bacterium]